MTETILCAITAIITAPLSSLLTAIFLKSKYNAEVEKLRAEVRDTLAEVRGKELDNDKKAIQIIMELVVEPLRKDMKQLQQKVDTLTNAIEKINSCPHADSCPVSFELRRSKTDDNRGSNINYQPNRGKDPHQRGNQGCN
ncbi:MAG: hypothetical protein HDS83_02395 [Bacteroidales bacterium]|nr:hypothetical protein [Bacteroidales bacterium]